MDAHITAYFEEIFQKIQLLKSSDRGEVWLASERSGRSTSTNRVAPSACALGTFSHTTHDPISGAPSGLASWMGQHRSTSANHAAPSACALGTFSQRLVILKRIALTGLPYRMLKGKDYPLIPRVLYCIEDGDETVVVEEYVQGESLLDRIGRKAYLSERETESVLLQLCEGLDEIHAQGIIHRDIKPSNLILQSGGIIRLIDFDAARTVKEHSGEDTMHLGTRGYAPPEQFGYGQTDARSDIYSIGITMRKALPEEYDGYLAKIFAKCTEIDPDRRYRNLQELRRALIFRRFWAGRGKPALWTLAIVSVVGFCLLPRLDGGETLPSAPASKTEVDSPAVRLPSAAEESAAAPTPETSDEKFSVQSLVPSDSESEQEVAVPTPTSSIEPTAHDSYMPPTVSQEERKSIKSVDAFLAEFKDDPEKLAYWQTRNVVFSSGNRSEEERLEAMKNGEMGLRTDAFIKNLPPMTEAERNRAIDEFVADQKRLLDI